MMLLLGGAGAHPVCTRLSGWVHGLFTAQIHLNHAMAGVSESVRAKLSPHMAKITDGHTNKSSSPPLTAYFSSFRWLRKCMNFLWTFSWRQVCCNSSPASLFPCSVCSHRARCFSTPVPTSHGETCSTCQSWPPRGTSSTMRSTSGGEMAWVWSSTTCLAMVCWMLGGWWKWPRNGKPCQSVSTV